MASKFSQKIINKTLNEIYQEHKLKPQHILSTSGASIIWYCTDKEQKPFVVKVRKYKGQAKKNEFKKEALLNYIEHPRQTLINLNKKPESFIYSFIKGRSLCKYYFFTDPKILKSITPVLNHYLILQKQTNKFIAICKRNSVSLFRKTFKENYAFFQIYKKNISTLFTKQQSKQIENILLENKKRFNDKFFLVHGDFHPKNILLTEKNNITFIDWSDVHLNNACYDLAYLWLTIWNLPKEQKKIEEVCDIKLLYLNILLYLPKYLQLLKDAEQATHKEYKKKIIDRQQNQNLLKLITQAKKFYKKNITNIIKNV